MRMNLPEPKRPRQNRPTIFNESSDDDSTTDGYDWREACEAGCRSALEGGHARALTHFDTALRLLVCGAEVKPHEEARIREQKAQVLTSLDRDFDAVREAERAAELAPGWFDAWLTLGRAQANLGEPGLAIGSLTAALRLEPNSAEATTDLARATAMQQASVEIGGNLRAVARAETNTMQDNGSSGNSGEPRSDLEGYHYP